MGRVSAEFRLSLKWPSSSCTCAWPLPPRAKGAWRGGRARQPRSSTARQGVGLQTKVRWTDQFTDKTTDKRLLDCETGGRFADKKSGGRISLEIKGSWTAREGGALTRILTQNIADLEAPNDCEGAPPPPLQGGTRTDKTIGGAGAGTKRWGRGGWKEGEDGGKLKDK
jgi:hypothetical protein